MKILFQGGYKAKRDPVENEAIVSQYTKVLAQKVIEYDFHIVTTWLREYDKLLADQIIKQLNYDKLKIKKHLTYFLSDKIKERPQYGIVKRYKAPKYWTSERTLAVTFADAVIIIGGGKGTADTLEKCLLSKKPLFIAYQVKGFPTEVWENYSDNFHYIEEGDADYITDENLTPEEFFDKSFQIIKQLNEKVELEPDNEAPSIRLDIHALRMMVATGDTDKAIAKLLKEAQHIDAGLMNELIAISGWLHQIRKDQSLGLADRSEEERRITISFLNILSDIQGMDYD